jgi:hypothetical protein
VPQNIEFGEGCVEILNLSCEPSLYGVDKDNIAVRALRATLSTVGAGGETPVELTIDLGAVSADVDDARRAQSYRIQIAANRVRLIGGGLPGLYYAVQTLRQLLDRPSRTLPACTIVDWPEYELRCVHWDTKHHQDRLPTLKRFLDQCAAFKINAVLFELEDKFEYPSHPIIGAPGAFTTAELQELTDYALERHIELIPDVQSPAHLCYVLKHAEFAHLRCDGSNYQICMDKPEARQLLFEMYDDVCAATQGARYFHLSTDEVYYAGICETARRPYSPENRSLTWVDYVNAAHAHITKQGRQVLIWLEYPALSQHVDRLPSDLLNGVGGVDERIDAAAREHGIRGFEYVSMQGVERLFPNYFGWTNADGTFKQGRIDAAVKAIAGGKDKNPDQIGIISAAWDDSGLHNETFWLGWAMTTQASWSPGTAIEEAVASFFEQFYGRDVTGMVEVYQGLQAGARFYEQALESLPSRVRPDPRYGYSAAKQPVPNSDKAMLSPGLPNTDSLSFKPTFSERYAAALARAGSQLAANDRLLARLHESLVRATRNTYNLEAFLSIARLERTFIEWMLAFADAEGALVAAAEAASGSDPRRALKHALAARDRVQAAVDDLYDTYERLRATWEISRYEKGRALDGRAFVHAWDDVKDHVADRRTDLSYLLEAHELMDAPGWLRGLDEVICAYAERHEIEGVLREAEVLDD